MDVSCLCGGAKMRNYGLALAASLVAALTAPHGTHAAQIDMSKMTCQNYLQADNRGGVNLMWMSGYFAGKRNISARIVALIMQNATQQTRNIGLACKRMRAKGLPLSFSSLLQLRYLAL